MFIKILKLNTKIVVKKKKTRESLPKSKGWLGFGCFHVNQYFIVSFLVGVLIHSEKSRHFCESVLKGEVSVKYLQIFLDLFPDFDKSTLKH